VCLGLRASGVGRTYFTAIMASAVDLKNFIDRQRILLGKEREAEIERSSLLLSNCGPKLLEQKGLSLGGLGIVGMNVGLGGKTYALVQLNPHAIG
jgi:hypothetical protein